MVSEERGIGWYPRKHSPESGGVDEKLKQGPLFPMEGSFLTQHAIPQIRYEGAGVLGGDRREDENLERRSAPGLGVGLWLDIGKPPKLGLAPIIAPVSISSPLPKFGSPFIRKGLFAPRMGMATE